MKLWNEDIAFDLCKPKDIETVMREIKRLTVGLLRHCNGFQADELRSTEKRPENPVLCAMIPGTGHTVPPGAEQHFCKMDIRCPQGLNGIYGGIYFYPRDDIPYYGRDLIGRNRCGGRGHHHAHAVLRPVKQ